VEEVEGQYSTSSQEGKGRQEERQENVMNQIVNGVLVDEDGKCGYCHGSGCHVCEWVQQQAQEDSHYCRRCDLFRPCFHDEKPGEFLAHINNPGVVKQPEERVLTQKGNGIE
jgi:hypothetical protein